MNNEILIGVLIGIACFLVLLWYLGVIVNIWLSWKLLAQISKQHLFLKDGFQGHVEASKKMLEFMKEGFDGNTELAKQIVEASAKHSESIMKLDTDNSQKIYDTLVV